ncbi:hypothetical protein HN51_011423 [Arachis hypogaea]
MLVEKTRAGWLPYEAQERNPRRAKHTEEERMCRLAAGHSLVSVVVDHIFICIKDSEFQLELLMQSLFFSWASLSEGENDSSLTKITIAGLCLSDKFSHLPCTLVQPSMHYVKREYFHVPEFARSFCHPIYPLGEQQWQLIEGTPLICLHSLQIVPSPLLPFFASQTVINCQPLMWTGSYGSFGQGPVGYF